ncbi:hypothetical protein B0H11DRAFT_1903310 [Mycena galericulata]|nr:hypothetical protein B0H11DRAFT_1903310 [Mycena galericulata]
MGWFSHDSSEADAHNTVNAPETHKSKLTHELIAAAASYEAARAYEKHVEKNGKPASHDEAKALIAALAGGFIDKIVETKGLDTIDAAKAKHDANEKTKAKLASSGEY